MALHQATRQGVKRKERQFAEDYFIYQVEFAAANLTPGSQVDGNIQIQADSDFKWLRSTFYADIAGAIFTFNTRPIPQVTVQIVDSGSGRQLVQIPVPVESMFGFGFLPYVLPIPRVFKARSNIQFTVANFSSASSYNLRLSLHGTKVFMTG